MPKNKNLIEVSLFAKLVNFFSKNKDADKHSNLIRQMQKTNPKLALAFSKWDRSSYKLLLAARASLAKNNKDTTEIDKLIADFK